MGRAIADITDVAIGRTLWQEWADYWPQAGRDDSFSAFINPVRKHVVTSTLDDVSAWENSTVVHGDPVAYVRRLKEDGPSGGISVAGGIERAGGSSTSRSRSPGSYSSTPQRARPAAPCSRIASIR